MAEESARRKEAYLRTGCNSFESERPLSKPMGFWRAQDVLRYTVEKQLEIAEPYGGGRSGASSRSDWVLSIMWAV